MCRVRLCGFQINGKGRASQLTAVSAASSAHNDP